LIDKDAIFTAEGSAITTSGKLVIGQITPISGEWGIATNPESFASYGYMKYFVDKNQGAVLRLAGGQITEISNYGMVSFFRDQLSSVISFGGIKGGILGSYDTYAKNYVLSIQPSFRFSQDSVYKTLTYSEKSKGWTSFFDYKPQSAFSSRGQFYTSTIGGIYKHHSTAAGIRRSQFYSVRYDSSVQFVFNPSPNQIKTFQTINYEGTNGWEVSRLVSDETRFDTFDGASVSREDTITQGFSTDDYKKIWSYNEGQYVDGGVTYRAGFDRKQNKYMAVIPNNTQTAIAGEVVFGNSMTGIKAYYATVTMKTDRVTNYGGLKELFAVGSTFAPR